MPEMFEKAALEVRNLSCSYGPREVLHKVSFQVKPGTICGLFGPNGSGKTTLFRCCLNFLPPSSGEIFMSGQATNRMSPALLSRLASYVPQEHRMAFPFPVRDVVRMGRSPRMSGLFRLERQDEDLVEEALKKTGVLHLAEIPCNRLSGGQRQLVLIARALAQNAPLMLLDEPTSALDFQNQLEVWNTLRDIAQHGYAVLVCCHDPNHILWFCDQVVMLKDGSILRDGPPGETMTTEVLEQLYGNTCIRGELATGMLPIVHPSLQNSAQHFERSDIT